MCFLDILLGENIKNSSEFLIPEHLFPYIDLPDFVQIELKKTLIDNQIKIFGKDQELWLLNRLDNETAWFLYFAKTQEAFDRYRQIQSEGKVHKRYIAQIKGTPKESAFEITLPVMHHKHKEDRMIVLHSYKDKQKWRSKVHKPNTIVKVLHTDKNDVSTLLVGIYKWVRHQIRVHLAGIWYPVIGDTLYGKNKEKWSLRLRSVGFQINE